MTAQDMQNRLVELERERQAALAIALRIEGAQALLREMLEKATQESEANKADTTQE